MSECASDYVLTHHDSPCPHFIMTTGEEVLQVQSLVARGDNLMQGTV